MTTASLHTNSQPLERLAYWINERERIRVRREQGLGSLTTDPILSKYRFCNVHREDDRVTRWIARNWRDPHYGDSTVWHAMVVARFLNWPPTLAHCHYPEPWSQAGSGFSSRLRAMEQAGRRVFTGAYIVSTNGAAGSKVDHVLKLFDRAYRELSGVLPRAHTCEEAYELLREVNGIGSFMAAQVVADIKYTALLRKARDWYTFVAPGPGSQRGLNRLLGYGLESKWGNAAFAEALRQLRKDLVPLARVAESMHLQDLQNCLCEFDKYERVLHGQGKPRSQYRPSSDPLP